MKNAAMRLLPGRMRLRVPNLKGNHFLANRLAKFLGNRAGIQSISINVLTGSVLIFYDITKIDHYTIILEIEDERDPAQIILPRTPVLNFSPRFLMQWPTVHVLLIGSAILALSFKKVFLGGAINKPKGFVNLAIFVSILSGFPVFTKGFERINRPLGMSYNTVLNTLSVTFLFFKESFHGLLISFIVNFAKLVSTVNLTQSRQVIGKLDQLPRKAVIQINGIQRVVSARRLMEGNTLIIHSGETLLVDGKVLSGQGEVDESRVTGYPDPLHKKPGTDVLAGSVLLSGRLYVRAQRVGADTYLSQVLENFEENQVCKLGEDSVVQKRINRLARLSLILTGGVYIVTRDVNRSLAMLLAALPSAAGLSQPIADGLAIGRASKEKIYFRDEKFLNAAAHIKLMVFEKTGALSTEELSVEEIIVLNRKFTQEDILRMVFLEESKMNLSLVRAVRTKAMEMNLRPYVLAHSHETGNTKDHQVYLKERKILVGAERVMMEEKVPLAKAKDKVIRLKHLGLSPIYVAVEGKLCGLLSVREKLKMNARETIEQLRVLGIERFVLMSRDSQEATESVGKELGIFETYGELDPYTKAALIHSFKTEGKSVAVIGDGIDDILAMGEADVGICLGSKGMDSAARAAGIVIASNDPQKIIETLQFAKKTKIVQEQNLNLALGLNVIGLGLGAAGILSPVSAGLLDNASVLAVLFKSINVS